MGIDKPDVRVAAHVQLPGTLEAYYRARGPHPPLPSPPQQRRPDGFVDVEPDRHVRWLGRRALPEQVFPALEALARCDVVRLYLEGTETGAGTGEPAQGSHHRVRVRARGDLSVARALRRSARKKLEAVRRYASGRGCRRRALLGYFGEVAPA